MSYFKCDGSVSASLADPSAYQCSTGWLLVDEPTFQLISYDQATALMSSLAFLVVVIAVWRELAR